MSRAHIVGMALVPGASGGIGPVYAGCLARRGHGMISVPRGQAQHDCVARRITGDTGCKATVLSIDLADLARVQRAHRDDTAAPEGLPSEIVRPIDDMVNAARAGRRGDWAAYEAAR